MKWCLLLLAYMLSKIVCFVIAFSEDSQCCSISVHVLSV